MTTPALSVTVAKQQGGYREFGRLYSWPNSTIPREITFEQALPLVEKNLLLPSTTNILSLASGDFSTYQARQSHKWVMDQVAAGRKLTKALLEESIGHGGDAREYSAGRGTEVHAAIEDHIDGLPPRKVWQHEDGRAYFENGFYRLLEFYGDRIRFIMQEVTCYGISEGGTYYAGTLDAIAEIDGILTMIDWKCVGDIKPPVAMQLAAAIKAKKYAERLTEEHHNGKRQELHDVLNVERAIAVQLTPNGFHIYEVKDVDASFNEFGKLADGWRPSVLQGGIKNNVLKQTR